jgi:deoxycitidine kinase/deoxyguanosine kinase
LDDLEWDLYLKWYNNFAADVPIRGIIHLTTDAATSQERIVKRGRSGEESIPLSYLANLEEQHREWIRSTNLPTLQVTTENMDAALSKISHWLTTIRSE